MPGSNDYTLKWELDASKFLSESAKIEAALKRLDALCDRVGPKLNKLGSGASRPLGNVARAAARVGTVLQTAGQQAATATTQMNNLGTAAQSAAGHMSQAVAPAQKLQKAVASGATAAANYVKAFLGFASVVALLNKVKQALDDLGKKLKAMQEKESEQAEGGLEKRAGAREYAGLLGKSEVDNPTMGRLFGITTSSGLPFNEATEYGSKYQSAIFAGVQRGNITPQVAAEMEKQGAVLGERYGLDAGTSGELMGMIPLYSKIDTAAKGLAIGDASIQALMEGKGEISSLTRSELGSAAQYLKGEGANSGLFQGSNAFVDFSTFVGVASLASKSGASSGVRAEQALRALNRFGGKTGDFLKKHGITPEMDASARLRALQPILSDPQADLLLQNAGFGNQRERAALIHMGSNVGLLDERTQRFRQKAGDVAGVTARNQQYLTSLVGQSRLAAAAEEFGEYKQGADAQELAIARHAALGRLRARGEIDEGSEVFTRWFAEMATAPTYKWAGNLGVYQDTIDAEVGRGLIEAGKRAGLGDLEAKHPGLHTGRPYGDGGLGDFLTGGNWSSSPLDRLKGILRHYNPILRQRGVKFIGGMEDIQTSVDAMSAPNGVPIGQPAPANVPANVPPPNAAGAGAGPHAMNGGGGGGRVEALLQQIASETARQTAAIEKGGRGGYGPLPHFSGPSGPYRPGSA